MKQFKRGPQEFTWFGHTALGESLLIVGAMQVPTVPSVSPLPETPARQQSAPFSSTLLQASTNLFCLPGIQQLLYSPVISIIY